MAIAYISHDDCLLHDMGRYHPEQPARLSTIENRLSTSGLDKVLQHYAAPLARRNMLEAVHSPAYVDEIYRLAPQEGHVWLDGDTLMNRHTLNAALRAVGAAVLGVDLVARCQAAQAFCAVRPPGHHAERDRAMGFCLFNNVAVGAYHALDTHGFSRVAIVDFDVHHGNGTEDIVRGDQRILFCSSFQHPFYPHSGYDSQESNLIHVPLDAGSDGRIFRAAVERHWLSRIEQFAPQLILISAGFDAHRADDMGGLNLLEADYAWVTQQLCEQAEQSAHGRIVSLLEGGYDLQALASSVEAHLRVFLSRE